VYPCACTRKEIADSALNGIDGQIYPGTCRNGIPAGREGRSWRVRTDHPFLPPCRGGERSEGASRIGVEQWGNQASTLSPTLPLQGGGDAASAEIIDAGIIEFDDALQGRITLHLENEIGDFVVLRADGLFAYQLAVVMDDAFQGITDVVRGADLIFSTPRQIYLQQILGLNTPAYMHLPVVVNAQGEKLSKQTLAKPVETVNAASTLFYALVFLRQQPLDELRLNTVEEILTWAIANWQPDSLLNCRQLTIE
ncbi:MAG: glutamate--tRNA ligase family protein, partial [Gallionella sp.]